MRYSASPPVLGMALAAASAHRGVGCVRDEELDGGSDPARHRLAVAVEEVHEGSLWRGDAQSPQASIAGARGGERAIRREPLHDRAALRRSVGAAVARRAVDIHDRGASRRDRSQAAQQTLPLVAADHDNAEGRSHAACGSRSAHSAHTVSGQNQA
jgi:hypothetical protein